jgi:hypothetical protein
MAAQEATDALLALQPMGDRVSDVYKEFNRLRLALQSSQQAFEESTSSVKAASDMLERAHAEASSSKLSLQELTHLQADLTASVSYTHGVA